MLEDLEPKKNYRCKAKTISDNLPESDRKIFLDVLADTNKWSDKGLSVALAERGVMISNEAIGRHRKQACSCYR